MVQIKNKTVYRSYHDDIHEAGEAAWNARRDIMTHNEEDRKSDTFEKVIISLCYFQDCQNEHFENGMCYEHFSNWSQFYNPFLKGKT